jgi:hypothetical protein
MTRPALSDRTSNGGDQLLDIGMAVVLSLATLASAWCAYQSALWGGAQTFSLVALSKAERLASQNALIANQFRAFDASMFIEYVAAKEEGSSELEEFLYVRFRPEMKRAVDAWLATDPFRDREAPPHPFQSHWYVLPQEQEVSRNQAQGQKLFARAQEMNQISDTYVLLTVLFASILFFGGMAGTLDPRYLKVIFGAISVVLLLAVTSFMLTMPRCRDCDVIDSSSAGDVRTSAHYSSDVPAATAASKGQTNSR